MNKKPVVTLLIGVSLLLNIGGCAPAVVGGTAAGVSIAHDRRTAGTVVDDQTIAVKARMAIARNKELWKQSHISVIAYNNVLLLVGQTPTAEMRQQALDAVDDFNGLRKIHNEITIGQPTSMMTRFNDSVITGQVKVKTLAHKEIGPNRVSAVTEDGVVYLMGLITEEEEKIAIDLTRRINGVRKVVNIFDRATG